MCFGLNVHYAFTRLKTVLTLTDDPVMLRISWCTSAVLPFNNRLKADSAQSEVVQHTVELTAAECMLRQRRTKSAGVSLETGNNDN